MKLALLSLLFAGAFAKPLAPTDRALRMGMKKSNGNGGKSSKGKGKSVDLVDTDAEVLALIYMERACFANPIQYVTQCSAYGGYSVIVDNGSGTEAEFCCPADAFDPTYVMMNPSTIVDLTRRRKLNEDVTEQERAMQEGPQASRELPAIIVCPDFFYPCEQGTISNPGISIIIGTTAYCVNTAIWDHSGYACR